MSLFLAGANPHVLLFSALFQSNWIFTLRSSLSIAIIRIRLRFCKLGSCKPVGRSNEVFRFNTTTGAWTELVATNAADAPSQRGGPACVGANARCIDL